MSTSSNWLEQISPVPNRHPESLSVKSLSGSMAMPAAWIEPKRVIYDHELVIIRSGHFSVDVEGSEYDCEQYCFIIIPPGHSHITYCLESGTRDYVHFDWQHTNRPPDAPIMTFFPAQPRLDYIRQAPEFIPQGIHFGTVTSPSIVFSLMDKLHHALSHDNAHERLNARAILLEVLIRLLDTRQPSTSTPHHQEMLAYRIRTTLDTAMSQANTSFSICDLLSKMGYSYEHLSRVFRKQYGLTPNEYIQSIRIEQAKHLLRQTDLIIAAIADRLGYADPIYFTRLFKRHTGMSPGKFRQL